MGKKYYVLKPFMYASKQYVRGDEFPAEELGMHSSKIEVRIKAHLIVEENKLTQSEKTKLLNYKSTVKNAVDKEVKKPEVSLVPETPDKKAENSTDSNTETTVFEEPSLFAGNNVGGGKGKNKNRN